MIVGNRTVFAIESEILHAFSAPSLMGIGYFAIHINGLSYGVVKEDATMLACSLHEVENRLNLMGKHEFTLLETCDSLTMIKAIRDGLYLNYDEGAMYFGIPSLQFAEQIYAKNIIWAPDGDEAFDDSSYVLQFDLGGQVRLIGFKCSNDPYIDNGTLSDVVLDADLYYGILRDWRDSFMKEWQRLPKDLYPLGGKDSQKRDM